MTNQPDQKKFHANTYHVIVLYRGELLTPEYNPSLQDSAFDAAAEWAIDDCPVRVLKTECDPAGTFTTTDITATFYAERIPSPEPCERDIWDRADDAYDMLITEQLLENSQ